MIRNTPRNKVSNKKKPSNKRQKVFRWSSDVKKDASSNLKICLFKCPLSQDYDRLWKRITKFIADRNWNQLDLLFKTSKITEEILKDFFIKKGHHIFKIAMRTKPDNYRTFILNKIPRDCAIDVLRKDNFNILTEFFQLQETTQRLGFYTIEKKELRIEKLIFLLKIDYEGITKFIKQNESTSYMNEAVKDEYQLALKSFSPKADRADTLNRL